MELLNRKITYRLYPSDKQTEALQRVLGLHQRLYNTLLAEHRRRAATLCGTLVPKELADRVHDCPHCGTCCGRDENTVKLLLRWYFEGSFWEGTSQGMPLPGVRNRVYSMAISQV